MRTDSAGHPPPHPPPLRSAWLNGNAFILTSTFKRRFHRPGGSSPAGAPPPPAAPPRLPAPPRPSPVLGGGRQRQGRRTPSPVPPLGAALWGRGGRSGPAPPAGRCSPGRRRGRPGEGGGWRQALGSHWHGRSPRASPRLASRGGG